ncbi:MAG: ABC transporter ATP-binding protein [Calditrichaceae bacterium]|nr:ABC transporter ATP-binding protein [Calditrichaceae bacterium]MBN2708042.1 ABC transporter ATP-binding protein [Calditrichaceae bacterium]RQV95165.1 MAG: ABC transporter ATP-binding protein [Calditrichota bacterium]
MNPIIIENLYKTYGKVTAVNGVNLEVRPSEIFGLIGPDGAGKTTIIRIIVSLLNPDRGQVLFKGTPIAGNMSFVRTQVGYMPQRFSLYQDLTVEENLDFFGDLFNVPKNIQVNRKNNLYEFSRLGPFKSRRAGALSGGMKQKLALSCMLMHEPDVIVLDEPTFGVDPVSRSEFWEILKSLAKKGASILVTTAYMDEAALCDRVAFIFNGRILGMDSPDKLVSQIRDSIYLVNSDAPHLLFDRVSKSGKFKGCELFGDGVHLTDSDEAGIETIKDILNTMAVSYHKIKKIDPGLEDVFLKLMNENSL